MEGAGGTMEHAEARELLDLAAVEPGGLDRLEAGDTPAAAALAGHLAGCAACAGELRRLRRTAAAARIALRADPVPADPLLADPVLADPVLADPLPAAELPLELRDRTLAYVRALGRNRAGRGRGPEAAGASRRRGWAGPAGWVGAIAAALVLGIGIGGTVAGGSDRERLDAQGWAVTALARVNVWTVRVAGAPGADSVALQGSPGSGATGSLLYSPVTGELIVVMNGVAAPPAGREYRCWVRTGNTTISVGRMYFGGDVGYWGGASPAIARVGPGTTFGVSLVDVSTGAPIGQPVLAGSL